MCLLEESSLGINIQERISLNIVVYLSKNSCEGLSNYWELPPLLNYCFLTFATYFAQSLYLEVSICIVHSIAGRLIFI